MAALRQVAKSGNVDPLARACEQKRYFWSAIPNRRYTVPRRRPERVFGARKAIGEAGLLKIVANLARLNRYSFVDAKFETARQQEAGQPGFTVVDDL